MWSTFCSSHSYWMGLTTLILVPGIALVQESRSSTEFVAFVVPPQLQNTDSSGSIGRDTSPDGSSTCAMSVITKQYHFGLFCYSAIPLFRLVHSLLKVHCSYGLKFFAVKNHLRNTSLSNGSLLGSRFAHSCSTRLSQRSKYTEGGVHHMHKCIAIQRLSWKCVQKK